MDPDRPAERSEGTSGARQRRQRNGSGPRAGHPDGLAWGHTSPTVCGALEPLTGKTYQLRGLARGTWRPRKRAGHWAHACLEAT